MHTRNHACSAIKKILHILPRVTNGGATQCPRNIARHLIANDFSKHCFVSLRAALPEARARYEAEGILVLDGPSVMELQKAIEEADIVQIEWWNEPGLYQFLTSPIPPARVVLMTQVCGDAGFHMIDEGLARWADQNVVCTERDLALPVWQAAGVTPRFILGAADLDRFANFQAKPHQGFRVGLAGTLDFAKLHPSFVELSAAAEVPDANFVVCGDGRNAPEMRDQAEVIAPGRFDFRGYVHDVRAVLEELDVYGYPLNSPSFAAAEQNLQEAMAAGVPPVIFPVGGLPWLVEHEVNGLIVEREEDYPRALERLHRSPELRKKLGEKARKKALRGFSSENSATKFQNLYEELMQQPKRKRQPMARFQGIPARFDGAQLFATSVGDRSKTLEKIYFAQSLEESVALIKKESLLFQRGLELYAKSFPRDDLLAFWTGLAFLTQGDEDFAAFYLRKSASDLELRGRFLGGAERILAVSGVEIPMHVNALERALASGRMLWIWGAGETGVAALKWLRKSGFVISGFLDADSAKYTNTIEGMPVCSPEMEMYKELRSVLVLANHAGPRLAGELRKRGWVDGSDFFMFCRSQTY